MIDNFTEIKHIMFNQQELIDKDAFYHLQIIKRKKDIEGLGSNNILIKAYMIDDAHPLDKVKDEIIMICEQFQARAYINIGPKSKRKVAVHMLNSLSECFKKNDFNYTKRLWNTSAGSVPPILKRWIIDCDFSEEFTREDMQHIINVVHESNPVGYKMIGLIPTLHGVHIITQPFDTRRLKDEYPNLDIHKNNPTVLYVPDSIMKKDDPS